MSPRNNRNAQRMSQSIGINIDNSGHMANEYFNYMQGANGYSIEQHLSSFSRVHPYSFLWSNWVIEKETYLKRLANISRNYTTFSSHGADHSEVILSRIEALLGEERIRLLSPTDAWLFLQCAYSHDIGMCVANEEIDRLFQKIQTDPKYIRELLYDEGFRSYLLDNDNAAYGNLFHCDDRFVTSVRFLLQIIDSGDEGQFKKFIEQVNSSEYSKAKNIYSTVAMRYFRAIHAKRTRDVLIQEAQSATLNEILPVRLRKIVAEIDYCHGEVWNEIISHLPNQDNGLSTDYIHPQFVAAMLRLGDLLDLDSNRYNPFQLELVGRLPKDGVIHKLKHMAIINFLVNPQWIDIEARYRYEEVRDFLNVHYFPVDDNGMAKSDMDRESDKHSQTLEIIEKSAKSLRDWITWLHDDLKEFSQNWNRIVPSDMPGYIASLRKNDIYIGDSDIPVKEDELELRYVISPRRASQIIEGSELYNDPLVFIREIVQNSIDATKWHIYRTLVTLHETEESGNDTKNQLSFSWDILSPMLQRYPVNIQFEYIQDKSGSNVDKLRIIFRDYGIGITYEKLKQMRHIGAITMSKEERNELQKMPQWLKPTGEYGIGMQTAFTVVDSVRIITYPRYEKQKPSNIKRTIKLYCPELGGDIVNEEMDKPDNETNRFGTDVIIDMPLFKSNIRKLLRYQNSYSFNVRSHQILDMNVIKTRLLQYISETFTNDIVSVRFRYKESTATDGQENNELLLDLSFPIPYPKRSSFLKAYRSESDDETNIYYWYNSNYDDGSNDESILLTLRNARESSVQLYYKGIIINNNDNRYNPAKLFRIPGVNIKINIMSGCASEFLEISRDYIKIEGYEFIKKILSNAIKSIYAAIFNALTKDDTDEQERYLLIDFFIKNPEHFMIFNQIVRIFKDDYDIDASKWEFLYNLFEKEMNVQAYRAIPALNVIDERTYIGEMNLREAIYWIKQEETWYTNYDFENLFSDRILLKQKTQRTVCAIRDNLSEVYDLRYGKLRIICDKAWTTKFIMLYTLTSGKITNSYPIIEESEYYLLCLIIISKYVDRYNRETDTYKKSELGNYILSFPAIKKYKKIAVKQLPAESPNALAGRFASFIICPCNVEKLSQSFDPGLVDRIASGNYDTDEKEVTKQKIEEYFSNSATVDFIQHIRFMKDNIHIENRIQQYKTLFQGIGNI